MAKEALFNLLSNHFDFDDIKVMDLFAGTGSISFEFASRGCNDVTSVDKNYRCLKFIKETSVLLKTDAIKPLQRNVFYFLESLDDCFDIIFADPPYDLPGIENLPDLIFNNDLIKDGGWLILEHPAQYDFSEHMCFVQLRRYGMVHFSIFEA
jgi:16S rRNA (guanine(966)-N(2))-methyltransferase RsmD